MRFLFLAALLAGCNEKLPEGLSRFDADPEHHAFTLAPDGETLFYIRGEYPSKTFLVMRKLSERKEKVFRMAGKSLYGPITLAKNAEKAWLNARVTSDSRYSFDGSVRLEFDTVTGQIQEVDRFVGSFDDHVDSEYYIFGKPPKLHKSGGWSVPWTARPSKVLGVRDGKLLVAVNRGEGAGLWTLELDEKKLPAYGPYIETARAPSSKSWALLGVLIVLLALFIAVFFDRINRGPRCSSC